MINRIFSDTQPLEKGLTAVTKRGEVIANNIANVDTPGFKAETVEFETHLQRELERESGDVFISKKTRAGHIDFDQDSGEWLSVTRQEDTAMRMDENNVDIDAEMAAQADNTIEYYTLVRKISEQLGRLSIAVEGR